MPRCDCDHCRRLRERLASFSREQFRGDAELLGDAMSDPNDKVIIGQLTATGLEMLDRIDALEDRQRDLVADVADRLVELETALAAVVGPGYCQGGPLATQDYVSKSAIAKVRAALARQGPR